MPHRFFRRSIIWVALVCQVLAGLGSMPVATAAATPPPQTTAHCHDHMDITGDSFGTVPDPLQHHCKHGVCHCACAHASAALPAPHAHGAAELIHPPLTVLYRVPGALHPTKSFFRPPI